MAKSNGHHPLRAILGDRAFDPDCREVSKSVERLPRADHPPLDDRSVEHNPPVRGADGHLLRGVTFANDGVDLGPGEAEAREAEAGGIPASGGGGVPVGGRHRRAEEVVLRGHQLGAEEREQHLP